MTEAVGCPRCLRPVPADAPFGACPACLLMLGLADTPDGSREGTVALTAAARPPRLSGASTVDAGATLSASGEGTPTEPEWPDIPGYEVIDELGVGGGGTVYLAKQLAADGRLVALKVIHGTSRQERERMTREMRALGRLTHPNVVTLFDADEAACGPYFTMEYLQGGSLARRIDERRPSPAETARIVEQVARAVQAAHDLDILHRDLKPSNVLLGPDGTAKVADFGLAKLLAGDDTPERLTLTDHVLGTPSYMAPEQAGRRHTVVGPRTDVYGLGGILYHCLTGRPPFRGETREETLRMVLTEELLLPRSIDRSIPAELEAVCVRCLEKETQRRYRSAGQIAGELNRWGRGQPTETRPLSLARRLARHRAWRSRGTRTGTLLLVIVTVIWAGFRLRPHDPPTVPTDPDLGLHQIEARLHDTGAAELIPAAGIPKWWRWESGENVFTKSTYNDGTCTFSAVTLSRLELLPTTALPPAFRLTASIRHEATPADNSQVGLYFGYTDQTVAGRQVRSWCDLRFSDFPPERDGAGGVGKNCVNVFPWLMAPKPSHPDNPVSGNVSVAPLVPPGWGLDRGWRTLVIEVRPSGVTLWGMSAEQERIPFTPAHIPAEVMTKRLHKLAAKLDSGALPPGAGPVWTGGGAIGLVVSRGQGSFKNVRVEALPD